MFPNRFRVTKRSGDLLKVLKGKTGVTPNILCRIAFILSLRSGRKALDLKAALDGTEFNTPTLFGDYVDVYEVYLTSLYEDVGAKKIQNLVAWHIEDGLEYLKRADSVADLLTFEEEMTSGNISRKRRRAN